MLNVLVRIFSLRAFWIICVVSLQSLVSSAVVSDHHLVALCQQELIMVLICAWKAHLNFCKALQRVNTKRAQVTKSRMEVQVLYSNNLACVPVNIILSPEKSQSVKTVASWMNPSIYSKAETSSRITFFAVWLCFYCSTLYYCYIFMSFSKISLYFLSLWHAKVQINKERKNCCYHYSYKVF